MCHSEEFDAEIPSEWEVKTYGDFIRIEEGSVNPAKLGDAVLEHYSIPAYDDGCFPAFERASTILSSKYQVQPGVFLISKLNPQFKRIWDPPCLTTQAICSTEFIVCSSIDTNIRSFCLAIAKSAAFQQFMVQHASSSTGSRKRIAPKDILLFKLAVPKDQKIIDKFVKITTPCLRAINEARAQIYKYQKLRSEVLPMIMSGQAGFPLQESVLWGRPHNKSEMRKQCR